MPNGLIPNMMSSVLACLSLELLLLTYRCVLQAALEHKIDPLGSPLHPDHHHDSSTGSVKRFKNVVFHSFRDKNRRGGIEAGHDSD